jgi:hypothetical protein
MDPTLDGSLGILPGTTTNVDPSSTWAAAGSTGVAAGQGTGRFGITPMTGGVMGTLGGGVESVWDWLNTPFVSKMSPVDVFLLVGVVLVAAIIWNLVLYHVRIAAETI